MGLGGCYSIIKYLLVLFNFVFWIVGVAGVIFSIWMLVDPTFSVSLTQESSDYTISVIIILVTSLFLVIVASLGMYGALREKQIVLMTFFTLLLIIFVAELSAGLWAYINSESLESQVRSAMKLTVEEEYSQNENRKLLFDTFQKNLHCCGAEKSTDWIGNKQINVAISSNPNVYSIPQSCCREDRTPEECVAATNGLRVTSAINHDVIYDKGCYPLIIGKLKENGCILMGIGITIAVIQILGLIFSLVLAFAVNRSNRYKA